MTEADASFPDADSTEASQTDALKPPPPDASPDAAADVENPDTSRPGCTMNTPCSDGISCTLDRCDPETGMCSHTPDSTLCPVGFVCDPSLGCTAGAYADSPTTLYAANLPSASVAVVGPTAVTMFDIALEPDGTLYGVGSNSALYTIDKVTASAKVVFMLAGQLNALDAAPDGTLYAAGGSTVYTINPSTGAQTFFLAYPAGYTSSGDLAIMPGGVMLATATGPRGTSDSLLSIDMATRSVTVVGPTGFGSIWGLAARGTSLFGFTAAGQILSLDTATGEGTLLATPGPNFYGASTR
jgi:hypothetical protein